MKKLQLFSFPLKRFKKEEGKKYIRKIRFYPEFMYFRLDNWLKKMSRSGWHIVDCGIFTYLFEQGEPMEKEYFTYAVGNSHLNEGYFSISLRYPGLKETYGVKKKKSKINKNEAKAHQIVEIDLQKINIETDVGYKELRSDRNRLHALEATIKFSFILGIVLIVFLVNI